MEKRPALEKIYRDIERPLTPVLARMELAGIAVDIPYLAEMSARMERDLRALEERIWQEAGEQFNVNSPVKLGQILFEKMKYPVGRKTAKTRVSSTGVEVLSDLAEKGYPDVTIGVYGEQWGWDLNYVNENVYTITSLKRRRDAVNSLERAIGA